MDSSQQQAPAGVPFDEPAGGWTPFPSKVEYAGGIAVLAPFVVKMESYRVVDGRLESYSNVPATVGGVVALLCGLITLTLLKKTLPLIKTRRVIAAIALLGAGALHIASGQGAFYKPSRASSMMTNSNDFDFPTARTPAPTPPIDQEAAVRQAAEACDSDPKLCPRARELADAYCDSAPEEGCDELAYFLMNYRENGGEPDYAAALAASQKGCAAKNMDACGNEAVLYFEGNGVAQDKAKGIDLMESACASKVGNACKNLGWIYEHDTKNAERAREYYGKACELGHGDGCRMYAFFLGEGKGGPVDKAQAILVGTKGCDLGNAIACANLAIDHDTDHPAAFDANRRGCDLNHGVACKLAALQLAKARGIEPNDELALQLFRRSCELDIGESCGLVGDFLHEGRGTTRSTTKASAMFERGCQLDFGGACFARGEALWLGDGVALDREAAKVAYARACKLGDKRGCTLPKGK